MPADKPPTICVVPAGVKVVDDEKLFDDTSNWYEFAPVTPAHESVKPVVVTADAVGVAGAVGGVVKLDILPSATPAEFVPLMR